MQMKTKGRNRLHVEDGLWCALSSSPKIQKTACVQQQVSH